ncbi:MAG: 30S ribosomal protein S21 [Rickettsia sp.]|nr:30S ribosomal protein S21 [Rickettsia sp.]
MPLQVVVQGGDGEKAVRELKRKMQREFIFRVMKMSRFYESPSMKKVRKKQESQKRFKKTLYRRRQEI